MDDDLKEGIGAAAEGTAKGLLSHFSFKGVLPVKPQGQILTISRLARDTLEFGIFNPGPLTLAYPAFFLENKTNGISSMYRINANARSSNLLPVFPIIVPVGQTIRFPVLLASDQPRTGQYRFQTRYTKEWLWGLIKARAFISSNWTFEFQ